jgi:hypothetical protein
MRIGRIGLAAAALAAVATPGASALPGAGEASLLVAAGPSGQSLTCTTKAHDKRFTGSTYHVISGSTTCGGAIEQSCQLTHVSKTGSPDTVIGRSVFSAACVLNEGDEGEFSSLRYRTVVHAPGDLVWVGAPTSCTGVGTPTLDCTFVTGETPL